MASLILYFWRKGRRFLPTVAFGMGTVVKTLRQKKTASIGAPK